MSPALAWILLGVVLFGVEMATGTFVVLWIGLASVLTAAVSFWTDQVWIQSVAFATLSVFLVVLTRQWAQRLSGKPGQNAHLESLVGTTGTMVDLPEAPGKLFVRIGGEPWGADAAQGFTPRVGELVEILEVRGNRLLVGPASPKKEG